DVLGLRSAALLVQQETSGTVRAGGGRFESTFFTLLAFGADGRVTRSEWFDDDCADQALARFDELRAGPAVPAVPFRAAEKPGRRVRPNAATVSNARFYGAVAARDADTLASITSEELEVIDHTTGVVYDRRGYLATIRVLLKAEHPSLTRDTLATLGDSLALFCESTSASGFV